MDTSTVEINLNEPKTNSHRPLATFLTLVILLLLIALVAFGAGYLWGQIQSHSL